MDFRTCSKDHARPHEVVALVVVLLLDLVADLLPDDLRRYGELQAVREQDGQSHQDLDALSQSVTVH